MAMRTARALHRGHGKLHLAMLALLAAGCACLLVSWRYHYGTITAAAAAAAGSSTTQRSVRARLVVGHQQLSAPAAAAGDVHCGTAASTASWHPYLHPAWNAAQNSPTEAAATAVAGTKAALAFVRPDGRISPSSSSSSPLLPSGHLTQPKDADVARSRQALQQFLASPDFVALQSNMLDQRQQQQQQQQQQHFQQQQQQQVVPRSRGILVVAGGCKHTTHLVVLLRVLRRVLHCTLPVEVAWQGPAEMNTATLASLQHHFGPLTGFDVQAMPYPQSHRRVSLKGWVGKVAALLHCSFQEVLLLDSDNLPLLDPAELFQDPLYRQAGNLFWPDFWSDWVKPAVYAWLGLNRTAVQPLLSAGGGWSGRDAESGMLLLDRSRWLAVLHWVFWINTWHDRLYSHLLHGDKDTFALGFALAGRADQYRQVVVPPGGGFRWAPEHLEFKCGSGSPNCKTTDGWQLLGALQHDNTGRAVFFHRTMDKLSLDQKPLPIQLITGPLPSRFVRYYLAHNSQGPTKGVWWQHVAPADAFQLLHIDTLPDLVVPSADKSSWQHLPAQLTLKQAAGSGSSSDGAATGSSSSSSGRSTSSSCPIVLFGQYMQAQQLALPVDPQPALECACSPLLQQLQQQQEVLHLPNQHGSKTSTAAAAAAVLPALTAQHLQGVVRDSQGREVPDGSAVTALWVTEGLLQLSGPLRVVAEANAALAWLKSEEGRAAFPALFDGSME